MSPAVRIEHRSLLLDSEPLPLLGGEIHYWRHDPALWPGLLDRACAMGLSFVSTYVPWEFHERAGGGFDFGGEAEPRCEVLLHVAAPELRDGRYEVRDLEFGVCKVLGLEHGRLHLPVPARGGRALALRPLR